MSSANTERESRSVSPPINPFGGGDSDGDRFSPASTRRYHESPHAVSPPACYVGDSVRPVHDDEVLPLSTSEPQTAWRTSLPRSSHTRLTGTLGAARGPLPRHHVSPGDVTEDDEDDIRIYIMQLDALRQECERRGSYRKAQECVDRMRDVNLRYARKIELDARRVNLGIKEQLSEDHRLELLTFARMWDDKLEDYNDRARRLLQDVQRQQDIDAEQHEGILEVEMANKRPRFSKTVVDMRAALQRFLAQRMYLEAEELKRKLDALEREELQLFDTTKARMVEERMAAFRQHCDSEYAVIRQKVDSGRDELLSQRQEDLDLLLKKHASVIRNLDQATHSHVSKTRDYIHRQVKALVKDPLKTGLELSEISKSTRQQAWSRAPSFRPRHTSRETGGGRSFSQASLGVASLGSSAAPRDTTLRVSRGTSF